MLGKLWDSWERRQKEGVEYASNISDNCSERVEKKECPTFLHKIVDRSLNLASCFDTEGKGTQFLCDACGEETWDQSPCSLPSARCHMVTASAVLYSDGVTTWVRLHRYLQIREEEAATAFLEDS